MTASADDRDTSGDALPAQARVWLRLLASGEVKASDAEAFQRWLHTSEAHRAAFHEVKQRWAALRPVSGEYLRTRPAAAAAHERALQGRNFGRRAFLGAAVSAAAVAGVAVVAYPQSGLWPAAGLVEGRKVGLLPLKTCHWSHSSTSENPKITHRIVRRISFMTKTSCRRREETKTASLTGSCDAVISVGPDRARPGTRAGSARCGAA